MSPVAVSRLSLAAVVAVAALLTVVLPALGVGYVLARYADLFGRIRMLTRPLGMTRWPGVGATLCFLAGFAWLSVAGSVPTEGEPGRYPVLFAVVGFAVGLFCLALAVSNFSRYRRLRNGPVTAGPARQASAETTAPLSGESCLAWAVRVREHSGLFRRGGPPPFHRESGGTAFVVDRSLDSVERRVSRRLEAGLAGLLLAPLSLVVAGLLTGAL